MSTAQGPFGPFPRGCGTAAAARGYGPVTPETSERINRAIRQLLILVVVLMNLTLAIRGEEPAAVLVYAGAAVITSAVLVRVATVRASA